MSVHVNYMQFLKVRKETKTGYYLHMYAFHLFMYTCNMNCFKDNTRYTDHVFIPSLLRKYNTLFSDLSHNIIQG